MADQRKAIPFAKSMTADKRAEGFAYLKENVLDNNSRGLYPAQDFIQENPDIAGIDASYVVKDIVGSDRASFDIKVFADAGSNLTKIYNLGNAVTSNTDVASEFSTTTFGSDGVYAEFDDYLVRKIDHSSSSSEPVGIGTTLGDDTTQFTITTPSGFTRRYTWVGGLYPGDTRVGPFSYLAVGQILAVYSPNFSSGNNGLFEITAVGTNSSNPWVEVLNSSGVNESNKALGSGGYITAALRTYDSAPGTSYGFYSNVTLSGFDGLQYWWVGSSIFSQLPGMMPVQVAYRILPVYLTKLSLAFYGDFMVIFCTNDKDIIVFFYDKANSTFFTQRAVVQNSVFLGAGVVDGQLLLAHAIGNSHNTSEKSGTIRISRWDGQQFAALNEITTDSSTITRGNDSQRSWDAGNSVLVFSVKNNIVAGTKSDIDKDFIYKAYSDGTIVAQTEPVPDTATHADVVRVFYDFTAYAVNGSTGARIYTNKNDNDGYGDYRDLFKETTYITNFLEDPQLYHRLDGMSFSFEKLFENEDSPSPVGEELLVYYRVSDRHEFTLLADITAEKVRDYVNLRFQRPETLPLNEQRYQVTKMPDGSALPEFNEIQFKLVLKNGMSLIGAWYDMSNLTRNTLE